VFVVGEVVALQAELTQATRANSAMQTTIHGNHLAGRDLFDNAVIGLESDAESATRAGIMSSDDWYGNLPEL
jgi:hypothetical protein